LTQAAKAEIDIFKALLESGFVQEIEGSELFYLENSAGLMYMTELQ